MVGRICAIISDSSALYIVLGTSTFPTNLEVNRGNFTDRSFNFSDADLERLYEQWEEDEEPLPVDELPEWDPRKPQPSFDLNAMKQFKNPEEFLKVSKKGKTLMIFVKVNTFWSITKY